MMADQFMRMGGRDPQGNARPVNVDENGNVLTQLMGSSVSNLHFFQNRVSVVGNGAPFVNDKGYTTLYLDITSKDGNTARTLEFIGIMQGADATYLPLLGSSNTKPIKVDTKTTSANERWVIDITGMDTVEIRLTSIDSGSVVVCGKAAI